MKVVLNNKNSQRIKSLAGLHLIQYKNTGSQCNNSICKKFNFIIKTIAVKLSDYNDYVAFTTDYHVLLI